MALNEIKAIGQVDLDLEAAGEQTMLNSTKERTALDESLEHSDQTLDAAIAVASAELITLTQTNNTTEAQILQALAEATGEATPGEETQWLAEQLGLDLSQLTNDGEMFSSDDMLTDEARAALAAEDGDAAAATPEATGVYEPSAEMAARSAEMLAFYQGYKAKFENNMNSELGREVLGAFDITSAEAQSIIEKGLTDPSNIIEQTLVIRQVELWKNNEELIDKVFAGTATEAEVARMRQIGESFLSDMVTEMQALAQEHGLELPDSIRQAMMPQASLAEDANQEQRRAFADSAPEHLSTVFKSSHDEWKAAVLNGSETQPFAQFLEAKAAADPEGFGKWFQQKMAVAGFYASILPIIEMLREMGLMSSPEDSEDGTEETPEAGSAAADAAEAAERDVPVERVGSDYLETFFSNNPSVNIADMFDDEGKFSATETQEFLLDSSLTRQQVEDFVTNFASSSGLENTSNLFSQGWSYSTLDLFRDLPEDVREKVVITQTGVSFEGNDEILFGDGAEERIASENMRLRDDYAKEANELAAVQALIPEGKFSAEFSTIEDYPEVLFNADKSLLLPALESFLTITQTPLSKEDVAVLIGKIDDFSEFEFDGDNDGFWSSLGGYIDEDGGTDWKGYEEHQDTAFRVIKGGPNYTFQNQSTFINWLNNQ